MIVLAVLGPCAVYATALAVAVNRRSAELSGHGRLTVARSARR